MDPNSRPVGTQKSFEQRIEETALLQQLSELSHNSIRRRKLFDPSQNSRCCFVTQAGSQCERDAIQGRQLCWQHLEQCRAYLRAYQDACKPKTRGQEIYKAAKKIVEMFFGNAELARTFITNAQNELPPKSGIHSLPLNSLETVTVHLKNKYDGMQSRDRQKALELAKKYYDDWNSCWYGRMVYRLSCEKCAQDEGHVIAYYIFKAATLVGKIILDS